MTNNLRTNKPWRWLMLVASMLALVAIILPGSAVFAQDPTPDFFAERCAQLTDPSVTLTAEEIAALTEYCSNPPPTTTSPAETQDSVTVSAVTQLYNFESGAQGWTSAGDSPTSIGCPTSFRNNWTRSTSMDGLALGSTWWTNTNDGRLGCERSRVTSPILKAEGGSVSVNFNSWSKNEGGYPTHYDVEHVQISIGGGPFTDVHGFTSLLHFGNDSTFRNITFTTPGVTAGTAIQYRFLYDTGDGCCGYSAPGRGWAFDNVLVTGASENQPPTVAAGSSSVIVNEGQTAANTGTYSDPNAGDNVTISASVGTVTQTGTNSGTWSWSFGTNDGPAQSQTVTITANDGKGGTATTTFALTVDNVAPTASLGNNGPIDEGTSATVSFSGAFDPSSVDSGSLRYAFDCNGGSLAAATYATGVTIASTSCGPFADNGSFTVSGKIMDKDGGSNEYTTIVTVDNVAPTLGAISVDQALVPVNTAINASASFTDPGTLDTHTAVWDWGDGTTAGTVTQGAGFGSVNDSHSYSTPGVYTIKLIVTDNDGAPSNESVYQYVVVYDPSGGFVTGGGWINSPAGAYVPDPSLTGKANFGFVAKYKKGANVPDGSTEFQFKAGDLNFHSSSYQWLVVAGKKAQFKGEGTINGAGNYGFMLTAIDGQISGGGGVDKFRIKIWDMDNGDALVYDNQMSGADTADPTTVLGGGSIVIHK